MSRGKLRYYLTKTYDIGRCLMIRLRALEILQEKGKTKYWLYKQLGMSYQNFNKMINNQTKSIRYENIEAMCIIFECTPNELFEMYDEK